MTLKALGADTVADEKTLGELLTKALSTNPSDGAARSAKGGLDIYRGRYDEAIAEEERAIAAEPSNIGAYLFLAIASFLSGQEDKAVAAVDKALRLSPRDPALAQFLLYKAQALSVLGRDNEAAVLLARALELAPDDRPILRVSAATLGNLGHASEAREIFQRYAALAGKQLTTLAQYKAYLTHLTAANVPVMVAWREHMFAGLGRAGMPEE
jgi:tetratricopeptide (TPR) repeat protein